VVTGFGLGIYEISDKIKWRLLEYESLGGRKAITTWRKKLKVGAPQAFLDKFLKDMVKKAKWASPDIDGLGERYKGLSELRWKCGRPHRIIGYSMRIPRTDGPEDERNGISVMLIGCTHDGKKYYPTECLESARTRKADIENGRTTISEYIVPFDR
jgi:hypothetical protein